jgi:cysteine desulfurase
MSSKKRLVYLDHAATTLLDPEVFLAMKPYFAQNFGNPSSLYKLGVEAYKAIENSRKTIAHILHALPDTIIFTSGGTESANMAILGIARAHKKQGKHIITTAIEHHAVLNPIRELEKEGFKITYLPVDKNGLVKTADVVKAVTPDTILISIMYANNEIGTIEPIAEIGREILKYRKKNNTLFPYLHTDACQAAGYLDLDVEKLHVDLMTLNASKIYGPKGTGLLYVRRGVQIEPLLFGGSQEQYRRAGTENVPGIIGFARALELIIKNREKESKRIQKLTEYFWKSLRKILPLTKLNGSEIGEHRLSNNLNIYFPDFDGETLVLYLDAEGIACSTGSACTTTSTDSSHVLKAIGLSDKDAKSSLRFTLGKDTVKSDITNTIHALQKITDRLKSLL